VRAADVDGRPRGGVSVVRVVVGEVRQVVGLAVADGARGAADDDHAHTGLVCLRPHQRVPDVAHRTDHVLVLGAELGPQPPHVHVDRAYVADEVVILDLKSGVYHGLESVGARAWELMAEPRSVAEVRDQLVDEYDVEPDRCESDLLRLLEELKSNGLVDVHPAPGR